MHAQYHANANTNATRREHNPRTREGRREGGGDIRRNKLAWRTEDDGKPAISANSQALGRAIGACGNGMNAKPSANGFQPSKSNTPTINEHVLLSHGGFVSSHLTICPSFCLSVARNERLQEEGNHALCHYRPLIPFQIDKLCLLHLASQVGNPRKAEPGKTKKETLLR